MRNPIPAAALAAGILTATACGSSPTASAAPPSAYQKAIDSMTAHCTQDAAQLGAMVTATHQLEVKGGVTDEPVTALAGHLATVVAAYGKRKASCVSPFAAYVTMRTGGS